MNTNASNLIKGLIKEIRLNEVKNTQVILEAAEALEREVFRPKLKLAQKLDETFRSAHWIADGAKLVTDEGVVIAESLDDLVSDYLSEYDPAAVRRATYSKLDSVTRMREAIRSNDADKVTSATPAFMNLVKEYSTRAKIDPTTVAKALSNDTDDSTEARLLRHITDISERGYRATHEPDDGGAEYIIQRSAHLDWEAWMNAVRWALHGLYGELELASTAAMLDHLADRMELDEERGTLDVGMSISGTTSSSYSDRVRVLAENIRTIKAASVLPPGKISPP